MVGYIVGVGLFGVPYALVHGGIWWGGTVIVVAGLVMMVVHLMFAQLIAASPDRMREVGIVSTYIGPRWRGVSLAIAASGICGGMLAYLIAGGLFAQTLLPSFGLSADFWGVTVFIVLSLISLRGRAAMARVETVLTAALVLAIVAVLALVAPHVAPAHLSLFVPGGVMAVFGIALYAVTGMAAVPTVLEIFRGDLRKSERAIIVGTLAATALTLVFGVVIAGASGPQVTEEAVAGLVVVTGPGIVRVAALFGLLGIVTSFLPLAIYLRDIYLLDFKLPKPLSWTLTLLPPLALYAVGARSFIRVIGFTGAVVGGVSSALIIVSYLRARTMLPAKKRALLRVPEFAAFVIGLVLACGALIESGRALVHLF